MTTALRSIGLITSGYDGILGGAFSIFYGELEVETGVMFIGVCVLHDGQHT